MFITAKIESSQLVDTIKSLRTDKSYINQTRKMGDLIEYFKPKLSSLLQEMTVALSARTDKYLQEQIKNFILSEFTAVVMKDIDVTKLEAKDIGKVTNYIVYAMDGRVNKAGVEKGLALTPMVTGKVEWWFNKVLRKFHDKFHRAPVLESGNPDLEEFAKFYLNKSKIDEDQLNKVKDIVSKMGRGKIQSLYDVISEDEEGSISLIDVLPIDEPLPDEIVKDEELKEILESEMKRLLEENELKSFQMYEIDNLSKKDIADVLKIKLKDVDKNLNNAKKKLMKSPKIRSLRASTIARIVKAVCNNYKVVESKIARKDTKDLVFEIIKTK
jgi:flagellar hook-basal body complex protein FliE